MFESIKKVGLTDSVEDIKHIIEHLLSVGEGVTIETKKQASILAGSVDKDGHLLKLKVVSHWKVFPDGTRYLTTIIFQGIVSK